MKPDRREPLGEALHRPRHPVACAGRPPSPLLPAVLSLACVSIAQDQSLHRLRDEHIVFHGAAREKMIARLDVRHGDGARPLRRKSPRSIPGFAYRCPSARPRVSWQMIDFDFARWRYPARASVPVWAKRSSFTRPSRAHIRNAKPFIERAATVCAVQECGQHFSRCSTTMTSPIL